MPTQTAPPSPLRPTPSSAPSPPAIKLALQFLAQQKQLPALITQALWNDIHGTGPASRMWWHNDPDAVAEQLDFPPKPR